MKHGYARHGRVAKEFRVWQAMLDRCRRPTSTVWNYYGGRGIAVCERWSEFANFIADMGPKPTPQHTLDRVNNDGNYEPANCRWALREPQARNRRNVRVFDYKGQRLTIPEIASLEGVPYHTMRRHLIGDSKRWLIARGRNAEAIGGTSAK